MRLYFDANIYGFIQEKDEAQATREWLDGSGHAAEASGINLLEAVRVPRYEERVERFRTITTVACDYFWPPETLRAADEVLQELRRCRPEWVLRHAYKEPMRQRKWLLAEEKRRWRELRRDAASMYSQYAVHAYLQDAATVDLDGRKQKRTREVYRASQRPGHGRALVTPDPEVNQLLDSMPFEEQWWRSSGYSNWYGALVRRTPGLRDYRDWLAPYAAPSIFRGREGVRFWFLEVDAERAPRNRLAGLIEWYQLQYRISHGNRHDMLHGSHLLDFDALVTADGSFSRVLTKVRQHFSGAASVLFVDRGAPSALGEIQRVLAEQQASRGAAEDESSRMSSS